MNGGTGPVRGILAILQAEEPQYSAAAGLLGADASDLLSQLLRSDSVEIAVKAASLAGYVDTASAEAPLRQALAHKNPQVRVAAAAALSRHPDLAEALVSQPLSDPDLGVRKWALRAVAATKPPGARAQVEERMRVEEHPVLQQLAAEIIPELPG